MLYDVVMVGGGPGGLAAALTLGRARKRVLLCDAGPRRNAKAEKLYNFVTRDGTPPDEFRRIGREQLKTYPKVEVEDVHVEAITGERGAFEVSLSNRKVQARRILLCTGMVDEALPIEGFRELWGKSIFQCPFCHGWEVQDQKWGVLLHGPEAHAFLHFALLVRGWTKDVTVFTNQACEVAEESCQQLQAAGVRIETAKVKRLISRKKDGHDHLESIELANGEIIPCDVLFTHPPQHQVALVQSLNLNLDEHGFVLADAMKCETSTPGIYAAGDLSTRAQGAVLAAATAVRAAGMINFELTTELAVSGAL